MRSSSFRLLAINSLATLGYISIIFQWLWSLIIVANPLLSSDMSYLYHQSTSPPLPMTTVPPSPFLIGVVLILTVLIFIATIYVLLALPKAIGKQGARVTTRAAASLVPVVVHHQKQTPKQRRKLSYHLTLVIKLVMILLPLVSLVFGHAIGQLTEMMIWIIGGFCAFASCAYFGLEIVLVKIWRVPRERAW